MQLFVVEMLIYIYYLMVNMVHDDDDVDHIHQLKEVHGIYDDLNLVVQIKIFLYLLVLDNYVMELMIKLVHQLMIYLLLVTKHRKEQQKILQKPIEQIN